MRRLEAELGLRLFDRLPRGVELTQAGELFLERARVALTAAESAGAIGRGLEAGVVGSVRLGIATGGRWRFTADLLQRFSRERPGVEFTVLEGYGGTLWRDLRDGRLDALVAPAGHASPHLRTLELGFEAWVVRRTTQASNPSSSVRRWGEACPAGATSASSRPSRRSRQSVPPYPSSTVNSTPGRSRLNRWSKSAVKRHRPPVAMPSLTLPTTPASRSRPFAPALSAAVRATRARSRNSSPAWVSSTPQGRRSNSRKPTSASSRLICVERPG